MVLLQSSVIKIGWQIHPFVLSDAEGKAFNSADLIQAKGLLIAFICNHCPYVKAIAGRLADDARALQEKGINVIAINANDYDSYPADSPPRMREFAAQHGFTFPYVIDEDQAVARAYDAVCTPDFFGFNSLGQLQYRGRLDDAKMADSSNRTPELLDAMKQIAATGRGPETQHHSIGCSIKWRH